MKQARSGFGVSILCLAAIAAGYFGGRPLLERAEFARAESNVQSTRQQLQTVQDLSTVFRHVGEVVEPSVVNIKITKTIKSSGNNAAEDMLRRFFQEHGQNMPPGMSPDQGNGNGDNADQSEEVEGSGVIMEVADGYGYILTNNHVAADAATITIFLDDGRKIDNAKVLGTDPKSDLAVIQIKADRLIAANWGNSDELAKGDWVLAFGSPFDYVGSMTHGIVSALNRDRVMGDASRLTYENFIQVDAPINPGNSGGPLVNIHGDVVGINTAIATVSGGFQGIGFAIPINQAHSVYTALKDHGAVVRGWLGVEIVDLPDVEPGLLKSFNYPGDTGVYIPEVLDNTPATDKLAAGDIIMSLNGDKMNTKNQLRGKIADLAPGTKITLKVWRDDKEQSVDVILGKQPDTEQLASAGGDNGPAAEPTPAKSLGMTFISLDSDTAQKFGLTGIKTGAVISSVDKGSAAEKAGLVPGDVITEVGKTYVHNAEETVEALAKVDIKQGVRLYVVTPEGKNFVFLQDTGNSNP
jgi:serine protease Do